MESLLLSVGLLHPLQHAGLSRRTADPDFSLGYIDFSNRRAFECPPCAAFDNHTRA
jgi:hypothetical protein